MRTDGFFYVNYDDYRENFWENDYIINIGGINFVANADNVQDAIDYIIDYCEDNLPGLLMTQEEVDEEEFIQDYICGGNHGRYINTPEVYIVNVY
ncbi:MAG: hypothetical protein ACOCQD_01225 [archaeon]